MTTIRFYNPVQSAYRDEYSNNAYEQLLRHIQAGGPCGCNRESVPASNISETDKEYLIEMAMPGVDKKNISIHHDNGNLTVRAEKQGETESSELYTRQEFDYSGTSRTFRIGNRIDTENIAAKYENGLLILHLPKKEAFVNKPARSIAVE
jgi:HSP20 family protein